MSCLPTALVTNIKMDMHETFLHVFIEYIEQAQRKTIKEKCPAEIVRASKVELDILAPLRKTNRILPDNDLCTLLDKANGRLAEYINYLNGGRFKTVIEVADFTVTAETYMHGNGDGLKGTALAIVLDLVVNDRKKQKRLVFDIETLEQTCGNVDLVGELLRINYLPIGETTAKAIGEAEIYLRAAYETVKRVGFSGMLRKPTNPEVANSRVTTNHDSDGTFCVTVEFYIANDPVTPFAAFTYPLNPIVPTPSRNLLMREIDKEGGLITPAVGKVVDAALEEVEETIKTLRIQAYGGTPYEFLGVVISNKKGSLSFSYRVNAPLCSVEGSMYAPTNRKTVIWDATNATTSILLNPESTAEEIKRFIGADLAMYMHSDNSSGSPFITCSAGLIDKYIDTIRFMVGEGNE